MTRGSKYGIAAVVLALNYLPAASASDRDLLAALSREYASTQAAASAARGGVAGPDAVQRQYDAARDLEIALRRAGPVSTPCRPLLRALQQYAGAQIQQAEGYDKQDAGLATGGRTDARRAEEAVRLTRPSCRPDGPVISERAPTLEEPGSNEAFFGRVRARAPTLATEARLLVDGREVARTDVSGGWSQLDVDRVAAPGRHDLQVVFRREQKVIGSARSASTWLLSTTALRYDRGRAKSDVGLSRELDRLGGAFRGFAGIVIRDLGRRSETSWNADARFPAASTVKLGVLLAALARFGRAEEHRYDLIQMTKWSSNLAANRLVRILGDGSEQRGADRVERALRSVGATHSTYTGLYRVGTSREATLSEPPLISRRFTTARDLTRIAVALHAAALGDSRALAKTGLNVRSARLALGLLLGSRPSGDNTGLVRPFVPMSIPIARKEGWLRDARHTVAIAYTPRGPVVITILTYRPGLSLGEAQRLGRSVTRAAGL